MKIREATMKDLAAIQSLSLKLFEKEYKEYDSKLNLDWSFGKEGTKYFSGRIKLKDGFMIVAEEKGELIGYLCGSVSKGPSWRTMKLVAELENMMVLPEFRSLGIGSKLTKKFFTWCRSKNADAVQVKASAQNELGIKFYRKHGFSDYTLELEKKL